MMMMMMIVIMMMLNQAAIEVAIESEEVSCSQS